MRFTKMHGCGNDYVYVNAFAEKIENPSELSVKISDRRKGIGGDGLILVAPSDVADARMIMYNLDGSEGKMCGNGIRCTAKLVYDSNISKKNPLTIETLSGIKTVKLHIENNIVCACTVDMGKAVFFDNPLGEYSLTCVSMGNPHAVLFVDSVEDAPVHTLGKKIEQDPAFPEGVNVEFIKVLDRTNIQFRVWERGSGETMACGTGACAAFAVARKNGLVDSRVTVRLLGGDLTIEEKEDSLYMTGEAVTVFKGEYPSYE